MVPIVQLVRASDCGSECRGFESHWAPKKVDRQVGLFLCPVGFEPTGDRVQFCWGSALGPHKKEGTASGFARKLLAVPL